MSVKFHLCLLLVAATLVSGGQALKCYQCGGIGGSRLCDSAPSMSSFEVECFPVGHTLANVIPGLNLYGHVICFTSYENNQETRGCDFLTHGVTTLGCEQEKCICATDLCNSAASFNFSSQLFILTLLTAAAAAAAAAMVHI